MNCRKIYRNKLSSKPGKILVIDDETYLSIDSTQVPGKGHYHCVKKSEVPIKYKLQQKEKFKKIHDMAIDECGHVPDPLVTDKSMTGELYMKECLRKILLPFINKYHEIENIVFWPDFGTSHYKKCVVDWYRSHNIDFVEKNENIYFPFYRFIS